jgi:uncharacterized protein YdiU (UPF0061 family)
MRKKLGLQATAAGDAELIQDLLQLMQAEKADFTLTFRRLADLVEPESAQGGGVGALFEPSPAFAPWLARWRQRLDREAPDAAGRQQAMYAVNPVCIPRNHLVEEAINAAQKYQDFGPFHRLVEVLARPFNYDPAKAAYATPPRPEQVVSQTFCGT